MFALINNNEISIYPYTIKNLREDNPDISFPEDINDDLLIEYDVRRVYPTDKPQYTLDQTVVEGVPSWENGQWNQTWHVVDKQITKQQLIDFASDYRWRTEVGGVSFNGITIATDDRSQTKIIGARLAAELNEEWETIWVAMDGSSHVVDNQMMILISDVVQAHVNKCFTVYSQVVDDIDTEEITKFEQIVQAFNNEFISQTP